MDNEKFLKAFNYAKQNPNGEYALEFRKRVQLGEFNQPLSSLGIDTASFKKPEAKDTSFMGKLKGFGSALIKSEKGFGESLAGAVQTQAGEDIISPRGINIGAGLSKLTGVTGAKEDLEAAQKAKQESIQLLINRIQEKRERGEDTTKMEKVLQDISGTTDTTFESLNPLVDKTAKQVLGEAAGVATDIIGAGTIGTKGAGLVTKPTSFLAGAGRGTVTGATTGGVFGAAQGGARAAQEGESISQGAILGGLVGTVAGGVLGGVTGGVSGAVRGSKIKKEGFVEDLVSPKLTNKVKVEALRQGRFEDPGLLKKATIAASIRDKQLAGAVDDVVSSKVQIGDNIGAVKSKITTVNNGARTFIAENAAPFNTNQLRSQLNKEASELDLIFASDPTAKKTYEKVVDAFVSNVKKKDTLGLFDGRQTFDQIPAIKKLLQSEGLGENARREIVLSVRGGANKFISKLLPKGNMYKAQMLEEHLMLEALGNMADKGASQIGKNNLQILTQQYPLLKWIVGGIATGIVGAAGIGVGGSLIGSTD